LCINRMNLYFHDISGGDIFEKQKRNPLVYQNKKAYQSK